MRILILASLMCCFFSGLSYAQNPYSVRGSTVDTASNVSLSNSSIVILNSKDSTLVKYTRSTGDGKFAIDNLKEGKFILLVSYPDYADYVEHFSLDAAKPTHDFGKLRMILMARLLQEVIVKGTVAEITIKGDTTEFNAAAFKTEANAKVEDLLKQLPGMQVDKDGKITAHGQTVNKVLVDGEEFFGDDPTLVTKNIRADMVDKVQLYDKKSDQATFTGIDDGERTKTLNIKLKEDKKSGYFGKVEAGGGNDEYFQGQTMFNIFKGKRKFSAYGTVGNTGKTGLGYQDNAKYGGGSSNVTDEGYIIFGGSANDELDSFNGRYEGQGIPLARSGGLHYDTKWKEDKQTININYKAGSINIDGANNTLTQNTLPTGVINSNSSQNFDNYMFRHKLDVMYLAKLDTTSDLKITVDGTLKNSSADNRYLSSSFRGNGIELNGSDRTVSNKGDQTLFNATVLWTKKLRKKGRTLSLTLGQRYSDDDSEGYLNSINDFYNTLGSLDSIQRIDQFKTNQTTSSGFNSNLAYTEPLSKTLTVYLNYGLNYTESDAYRKSFNKSVTGAYDILDRQFSNDFNLNQTANQAGAVFIYRKNKTTINFGSRASLVDFQQTDLFTKQVYGRDFMNWIPQASYVYAFSNQKSLRVSYNGNSTQPTLDQIQPIRVNTDPLNIVLGNPELGPSFNNRFNINYNSYKVLSDRYIYVNASYGFVSNAVVNNTITDAAGKSTYQSINLDGQSPNNFYMRGSFSQKIPGTKLRTGMSLSTSGNTYYNMINNELNKTISNNHRAELEVSIYTPKKYNLYFYGGPSYNTSEASLQKRMNNNGWALNADMGGSITLPGKVSIGINASYLYQQKTQTFNEDFVRLLVSPTLTKSFFKADNLKIQLSGNDLLNQNSGFSRRATSNMITQNSYTTIKRYGMFSIIYDLSKMGGPQPQ